MKKPFGFVFLFFLAVGLLCAASVTVTKPAANATWVKGQTYVIAWTIGSDIPPTVRITLRDKNSTTDVLQIADPALNAGFYKWLVPANISDGQYRIRVQFNSLRIFDDSEVFNISSPVALRAFGLTAPNGGESWPLDSTRQITWEAGEATGTVRLDLYKGGTVLANKVGTITTNTPAAAGKYSWSVGSYIGGKALKGSGYLVVISFYTPEIKDSSDGPFTITEAQIKPLIVSTQDLSLTNPRRGDLWYKGTGYNITWTYPGLAEFPVRLDLMQNDGTTLVLPIAENIANDGQHFWAVPLSLPDAETLYKMRIRTMDGQYSDTAGPFKIAKAMTPAGQPAIKVIAPVGPAQVGTGIVYPIRWTSTCGTSTAGPTDDGFDIHLTDPAGTVKVKQLLSGQATYDGGNPDGSHSWHWDWHIMPDEKAGTYCVSVTNWSGQCTGIGTPFQLVYPQEFKEYKFSPSVGNCLIIYLQRNTTSSLDGLTYHLGMDCISGLARVGYRFFTNRDDDIQENFVLRSKLTPNDRYWYKDKGHILSAKITIERKSKMEARYNPSSSPCLGGVVVLDSDFPCQGLSSSSHAIAPNAGVFPVDTSQGEVWEVDLSNGYLPRFQQNKPDYGLILYPAVDYYACPDDWCDEKDSECYKITLTFRFAKDITQ
jgi:hypothetical protein